MGSEPITEITCRGYTIEIHSDDSDTANPLTEFDGAPTLVLHEAAERKFGWTTDDYWASRLNAALQEVAERGHTTSLHGERGALTVIQRWMKAYHGIEHILHVGAGDHSGYWVYTSAPARTGAIPVGGTPAGWVGSSPLLSS